MNTQSTWFEVLQWYYREARLLDDRRFDRWLELLAPDVSYRVPSRYLRNPGDVGDFATWSVERELSDGAHNLDLIDDDRAALCKRIARLTSGMAWAESPPSFTRRLVSNLEIETADDCIRTVTALVLVKNRATERELWSAQRRDELVRDASGALQLRARLVVLDDAVLPAANLSAIF